MTRKLLTLGMILSLAACGGGDGAEMEEADDADVEMQEPMAEPMADTMMQDTMMMDTMMHDTTDAM